MDMSQYRDLFLSEAREHLNSMNCLLAVVEQGSGDRDTVDALFREAHSIKGMAASMGFERMGALAHHLENFLDRFRSSGALSNDAYGLLLEGVDLLEGLLDDLMTEIPEREVAPFLERPFAEPTAADDPEPPSGANESDVGSAQILMAVEEQGDGSEASGSVTADADRDNTEQSTTKDPEPTVFQVLVDIDENAPASAARALLILREMDKAGNVLSSRPTNGELRDGAPCRQIRSWLSTSLSREHIEEQLRGIADVKKITFVDDRRKDGREEKATTVRVRTDLLDQFVNLTGELITHRYMLETASGAQDWEELNGTLRQAGHLIADLHHYVLQARLMPLESVTARLPRVVRDLSRKTGKKVSLQVVGGDVGIDRVVLEQLSDPLVHLVRNAIDHGIDGVGTVTISARREKDLVLVEVADDGCGMSPEFLRERAVGRGVLTEFQAEHLSDRDALMLICKPGFSTTTEVTETSGRGVGMDVVKAAVEKLGGSLDIHSVVDEGTRFQMWLPISIAIIKILLINSAGRCLAIPITRVLRTLDLPATALRFSGPQKVFDHGEEVIPLVSLSELLDLPVEQKTTTTRVVVTEVQGRRVGLQVDEFLGQREAFVKSLGFPLNKLAGLSGATLEGEGRVFFILDPQALLEGHAAVTGRGWKEGQDAISPSQ